MRRELRRFLKGRSALPPYREFQRAGLKSLRDNVTRRGGARRWASELGIPYVEHRPGYAPRWTEEHIREELAHYLAGRELWPARAQFERDGRKLLRDAINRTGGPDRWSAEFGLPRPNRLSGIRRAWTPQIVEAELRRLVAERRTWPSRHEFQAAGLASLLSSIYAHEGPAYWARRLGVEQRSGAPRPRQRFWTEERIREELERFCAGRTIWPTEREFIVAERRALYQAASRHGGITHWAAALGLPRRRNRS